MNREIIDCHIHPYLADAANTKWFEPRESPDRFVELLKKAGITQACGSVVELAGPFDFAELQRFNREALRFRDRYPDFYLPGIHVHPGYPDESCAELESYVRREGVRWIGEIVGYIVGFDDITIPGARQIFALAQSLHVPVNVHTGDLKQVENVCRAFPQLPIVLAHPTAAKSTFLERVALVAALPNLYLDLSGSGLSRWGMLRYAINQAGPDRFVFGTDFPICNPATYVSGVEFELLNDAEKAAVFAGNFNRLIGT